MTAPELKCPNCGYDLHGLATDRDGVFRCPECGGLTDIMTIVDVNARRTRHDRRIWAAVMVTFSLFGLVGLVSWLQSVRWFGAPSTLIVSLVAYFVLVMASWRWVARFEWRSTLIWAALIALILALPRTVFSNDSAWVLYPAGLAIFIGVMIRAGRRGQSSG